MRVLQNGAGGAVVGKLETVLLLIAILCSMIALVAAGFIVRAKDGFEARLIEWETADRLS